MQRLRCLAHRSRWGFTTRSVAHGINTLSAGDSLGPLTVSRPWYIYHHISTHILRRGRGQNPNTDLLTGRFTPEPIPDTGPLVLYWLRATPPRGRWRLHDSPAHSAAVFLLGADRSPSRASFPRVTPAQRQAVDRIVHRYGRLGAVLLDPDVGDDELRARLLSTVPEAPQLHEDQFDLANWDAGRPQGPLRADRRAARRAEPVRLAVSEQDEVRRRAESCSR